ncbi:hypothetical protein [Fodinibius sp.]|uniref:hypothetical protein n=1 Tax=Fodinibius sp. TaxID=1872440 RepID=UPI002ACDAE57|nr:hypothetical protein [Fodinibius sp.]MDZ7658054.1 hypothetical protein [Fodinibius sp.]
MTYHFDVETKESGQRRKYGDSYYHYIIEDKTERGVPEHIVKQFCTGFVEPARYSQEQRKEKLNEQEPGKIDAIDFASYYTKFEKIGDRKYEYKVVSPSTC